jgi:hypothetical protein
MRDHQARLAARFALAVTTACVAAGSLSAQAPATRTQAYNPPRAADGRPDLQGIYNVATMTPVERPVEFGNRLVLTPEEVAALEQHEQRRQEQGAQPSQADRQAPPVGGDRSPTSSYLEGLFRGGGGVVGGYNLFWIAPGSQVVTVDGQKRSSLIVDPPDGRVPAMRPEARARYEAVLATRITPDADESAAAAGPSSAFDGPEVRPLAERCLLGFSSTSGPPTLPNYWYNNLKQIVQTRDTVMILNEMVHDVRIIRIGGTHPPAYVKKWLGDSIGRWEGDTLVVETTNFTDKTQFRGSGEDLRVVERFTRTSDTTLLYRFTVEDPSTWERPWTGEYPWVASDEAIYEYACHEGNYSFTGILRGARLAESEAAARKK